MTTGQVLHASCVAYAGRGVLILGPSGSGKSALALQMMALGADLVSDDRTILIPEGAGLVARCPDTLRGLIEARGIGILHAQALEGAQVVLAVDLSRREVERLPPKRQVTLMNVSLDLVLGQEGGHFPSALLQLLKGGRQA